MYELHLDIPMQLAREIVLEHLGVIGVDRAQLGVAAALVVEDPVVGIICDTDQHGIAQRCAVQTDPIRGRDRFDKIAVQGDGVIALLPF